MNLTRIIPLNDANTSEPPSHTDLLRMTSVIVAAFASGNAVPATEIPDVIALVFGSLSDLGKRAPAEQAPTPAVPVRKSIHPDYIVCLEDGKRLKLLRRHLRAAYGMTPEEYRAKWRLPSDYPMVAPGYAATRSTLAKAFGLGRNKVSDPMPTAGSRRGKAARPDAAAPVKRTNGKARA